MYFHASEHCGPYASAESDPYRAGRGARMKNYSEFQVFWIISQDAQKICAALYSKEGGRASMEGSGNASANGPLERML